MGSHYSQADRRDRESGATPIVEPHGAELVYETRVVGPLPDGTARTGRMTFPFCGCLVGYTGDGRLRIFERSESGSE